MRRISLYGHVVELLGLMGSATQAADQLAGRFLRERRYLGARDRRFISDLFFDILRNHALVEFHARQGLSAFSPAGLQVRRPGDAPGGIGPGHSGGAQGHPDVSRPGRIPPTPAARPAQDRHPGDAHGLEGVRGIPAVALVTAHQLHIGGENPETLFPDVADLWRMAGAAGDIAPLLAAIHTSSIPRSVLDDPVARMSLQHSIPEAIVREWTERFGEGEAELLCRASNTPAPTTIRVNTLKCSREECRAALAREGIETSPTRYSPVGLVLDRRVNTGALESYRSGMFEMQDEGSQLISMLADPPPGSVVVDACAGAGGKSLHIAAMMNGEGTIHAFDPDPARLRSLRTRAHRSGAGIIREAIVAADAEPDPALAGSADLVLIDAPCSGVGTYRRNPGSKAGYSVGYSASLAGLQYSLLERYHGVAKPGGRLVYATCTLLRRENEVVVERFLETHRDFRPVPVSDFTNSHGIPHDSDPYLQLLPHRTNTDGFFAAVLERVTGSA